MIRTLAVAAMLTMSVGLLEAQPTASLPIGFTFVDWTTVNDATVGGGAVDDRDVLYYLKEEQVGDFQSWLIFFDPSGSQSISGTVTFDNPIAFLYTSSADVNVATAAYRLTSGVTYAGNSLTGLESADDASFTGNTLSIDWTASDPGDHVRVLTSTVPEPSTYALMVAGLCGLFGFSRRRRKA